MNHTFRIIGVVIPNRTKLEQLRIIYMFASGGESLCAQYLFDSDLSKLKNYLLALYPSQSDAQGRPSNVEWQIKKDNEGKVELLNGRDLTYTARLKNEDKTGETLLNKLKNVPTGWYTINNGEIKVTDKAGFADFVLLTIDPDIRKLGVDSKNRLDPDAQQIFPQYLENLFIPYGQTILTP